MYRVWWENSWMKLLLKRTCRPVRNLVLDRDAPAAAELTVSPLEDEQVPLVSGSEVGYILLCMVRLLLDEEVDELMGSNVPTIRGTSKGYIREEGGSRSGCFGGTSCETCDSRGEMCDTQTQQCSIGNGRAENIKSNYAPHARSFPLQ